MIATLVVVAISRFSPRRGKGAGVVISGHFYGVSILEFRALDVRLDLDPFIDQKHNNNDCPR